jgi:L-iditol 2-dehydrogenase
LKAVFLITPGKLALQNIPAPRVEKPTDALLRMQAVGICGSDIHYFKSGRIGDQIVQYPWIVGHECAAIVAEVGTAVKTLKPGDAVVIDPLVACGNCDQCLSGRRHTCRHQRFLGCPGQMQGGLAEYLIMPEECCFPFPPKLSLNDAALAEPLSIGIYAVELMKQRQAGTVAISILGCGPIGLCVMTAAQAAGIKTIYATERLDYRLDAASRLGAIWTGNVEKSEVVPDILAQRPTGLDAVFDCSGDQQAFDQAIQLLKPGGLFLIVGIPETDRVSFDISLLRRKEITIQNVRRQNDCVRKAIELIASGKMKTELLVTHRFALAEAQKAFEMVADYRDGVIKAVIRFDE